MIWITKIVTTILTSLKHKLKSCSYSEYPYSLWHLSPFMLLKRGIRGSTVAGKLNYLTTNIKLTWYRIKDMNSINYRVNFKFSPTPYQAINLDVVGSLNENTLLCYTLLLIIFKRFNFLWTSKCFIIFCKFINSF